MVMVHARALLTSTPQGRTTYLEADLRSPEAILSDPALRETLDLNEPVALMLVAVLHFIEGYGAGAPIVRTLMDALPSGSFVVITNATKDLLPPKLAAAYDHALAAGITNVWPRDRAEFTALFDGYELIEPGVTPVSEWRAEDEPTPRPDPAHIAIYAGVARKP
jgi:hypothetical protein